jgi:multiple sugar transport system permease protein
MAFAFLPVAGILVFFAIPFAISVFMTFRGGVGGAAFAGLRNYAELFGSEAFRLAASNTARFMGVGVPLAMALSLAVAMAMSAGLRARGFFRAGLMLPMAIPTASVILFFQIILGRSGTINYFLALLGKGRIDFLASGHAFAVAVFMYVWKNFGYNMVLFMAGLGQIPGDYYKAAEIDGASKPMRFIYITMPLLAPAAFFIFIMSVTQAFRSFREIYALSGSFPHKSLYMMQHFINNNFQNLNYQRLGAAAFLTFAFIFALVGALFAMLRKAGDHEL